MDRIDSIKISPSGSYDNSIEIWQWDTDGDAIHLKFPKGTKIVLGNNGLPNWFILPDGSKLYMNLDEYEKKKIGEE